ncbi:MAG: hypothetical protein ACPIOQ_26870, partial [Promethearchaeia archaeon]
MTLAPAQGGALYGVLLIERHAERQAQNSLLKALLVKHSQLRRSSVAWAKNLRAVVEVVPVVAGAHP